MLELAKKQHCREHRSHDYQHEDALEHVSPSGSREHRYRIWLRIKLDSSEQIAAKVTLRSRR
jgi:hypothetical protein